MPLAVSDRDGGAEFPVLVSAGSARPGIRGIHGDALKVAVGSPPERGRANDEAMELVARWLGVAVRDVRVVAGKTSRRKRIRVSGRTAALVAAAAGSIGQPGPGPTGRLAKNPPA